jgi:hypothetical protein
MIPSYGNTDQQGQTSGRNGSENIEKALILENN